MIKSARISQCERYRYTLDRVWDDQYPRVTWVMLNPSTADASVDDPTIRKCIGFSQRWDYGAIRVLNLFAWRATKPRDLLSASDPVGPDNNVSANDELVVVAWGGSFPKKLTQLVERRVAQLRRQANGEWVCLGLTKTGHPRHPLMLAYATELMIWEDEVEA